MSNIIIPLNIWKEKDSVFTKYELFSLFILLKREYFLFKIYFTEKNKIKFIMILLKE